MKLKPKNVCLVFLQENCSAIWCPQGGSMPTLKRLMPSNNYAHPEHGNKSIR
jgi:hypothetical protein